MLYPEEICNGNEKPSLAVTSCGSGNPAAHDYICNDKKRIDECRSEEQREIFGYIIPSQIYIDLANYLERKEGCSGFCKSCPHPMYSDCANGKSLPTCETKLADIMKSILSLNV